MAKIKEQYGPAVEDGTVGSVVDGAVQASNDVNDNTDWLGMARTAYESSTKYLDSSLRSQWERNERAFQSRHPPGSKYHSDAFKYRSKIFRPKTRSMMRQAEAQLASSFFSNEDVASVTPADASNQKQVASAAINKELLQHRLTSSSPRVGVPWFLTLVGAYQNAQKYGIVVSRQTWLREVMTRPTSTPAIDPITNEPILGEDGLPVLEAGTKEIVRIDRPDIMLLPPENFRIDKSADWRDPINTSPYTIALIPMYVYEVEARMNNPDPRTGKAWMKVDRTILKQATGREGWDSTRQQREGNREDSTASDIQIDEYTIVWVHENIFRRKGWDYVFYTAGTHAMLSEADPIEEVFPHCEDGERPYVMGFAIVEANKTHPAGKPELTQNLQHEANEIANLRLDNVKLAMQKRYLVRRGAQVDLRSIVRNTAGSVTLTSDPERDVKALETRDVTQSSFMEQDRINADYDDLAGTFSTGSVQTNRRLNETVGGMKLMAGSANLVGELDLRVFTETYVEPVLRQLVKLEQHYENDVAILALAGERAELFTKFGINEINDELLRQDLAVRVNVGIGATDPMQRLQKIQIAAQSVGTIFGDSLVSRMKPKEILGEIFGPLGYRDGSRFFDLEDFNPVVEMLQKQIQEMQGELETRAQDNATKERVAKLQGLSKVLAEYISTQGRMEIAQKDRMASRESEILEAILSENAADNQASRDSEMSATQTGNDVRAEFLRALAKPPSFPADRPTE